MTFVFIVCVCIFIFHGICLSTANEPLRAVTDKRDNVTVYDSYINIKKCCSVNEYYKDIDHECVPAENVNKFNDFVTRELLDSKNASLYSKAERLLKCRNTDQDPEIRRDLSSYVLFKNGSIFDTHTRTIFETSHYCLELAGKSIQASVLVLYYCHPTGNEIPKCCPNGHYFDTGTYSCSPISTDYTDTELSLKPYISDGSYLIYKTRFNCSHNPVHLNLGEIGLTQNILCISRMSAICYHSQQYCIANLKNETQIRLCPIKFINKCCPDKQSLHEYGCQESNRTSPYMAYMSNTMRYKIRDESQLQLCTPNIIEDTTKSKVQWNITSAGLVDIEIENSTISTDKFCVDDVVREKEIYPAIKVCSEEVNIMHQFTSTEDWPLYTLEKCCGKVLQRVNSNRNFPQCVKKSKYLVNSLNEKVQDGHDISNLVFSGYPNCSYSTLYHIHELRSSYNEDVEITNDKRLNCEIRSSELDYFEFCLEFIMEEEMNKTVAIVCSPHENSDEEKRIIVVTVLVISCIALILAFLLLIFVRIRSGLVILKKINTLSGRILLSYVISHFVGFLAVAVASLNNFKGTNECSLLAGFVMFFVIASFCWNTSICLEGLLLTVHVQLSDISRYTLHSLWAWGVPGILTAVALTRDTKREKLPCDDITPRFGVDLCFLSDLEAQWFYFYCPISLTVLMNGCVLIVSKIIRKRQQQILEISSSRQGIHGNMVQATSVKSTESEIKVEPAEPPIETVTNPSESRTHPHKYKWIECLKLIIWSGVTWLMEVLSTILMVYTGRPEEELDNYLWVIPLIFNSLRGLGIFVIISLTSENKDLMIEQVPILSSHLTSLSTTVNPLRWRKATYKDKDRKSNGSPTLEKPHQSVETTITHTPNVTAQFNTIEIHDEPSNPT